MNPGGAPNPQVLFCPYCGAGPVRLVRGTPRCMICRVTFFVQFGRRLRRSPKAAK